MKKIKRVFLIVADSFGIGAEPDADMYGDEGTNTLRSCFETGRLNVPEMAKMGLFNIDGVDIGTPAVSPSGAYGRMREASKGKDTTTGHWEIAGIISKEPMPTFPDGFPEEIIKKFEDITGRKVLCNKPYSGTKVIADYGREAMENGGLIVYTSADSVFQIAAHEDIIPVEKLYEYCEAARNILTGKYGVGRVIARPFSGEYPFVRTPRRHDFSLVPPKDTMLDLIGGAGMDVIAVGKINDIFAGKGITEFVRTENNSDGMDKTIAYAKKDFHGLCFVNLVDFDMAYGHRRDPEGYTNALNDFDSRLAELKNIITEDDIIIVTADHGCDPTAHGTDHTREYIPVLVYGKSVEPQNIGTGSSFADIGASVCHMLGADSSSISGKSFAEGIIK
ncbi:MAG: phosphopentomutase [Oscillospiraceae bacterium]|nr:phosphopentomutase [Oscillospiraceae bacterium]MDY2846829.1 phosphopentomutase [Oscillospiraceae bacterium]